MTLDFDFAFLEEAVRLCDRQLDQLESESRGVDDPDAFGYYDRQEYITGLGFAVGQQYLTARTAWCKLSRGDTLNVGPIHRCGAPIVAIVNAAGNYWKHSSEWVRAESSYSSKATRNVLESLGVDLAGNYVLTQVLYCILNPLPPRFGRLLPFIERWRDDMQAEVAKR